MVEGMTMMVLPREITMSLVADRRSRACASLRANHHNGVLHAGHHNGVVTLWSPAMGTPLVRMLAHPAPITSLAVEKNGRYMVTSAMDKQVRQPALRLLRLLSREGWGGIFAVCCPVCRPFCLAACS